VILRNHFQKTLFRDLEESFPRPRVWKRKTPIVRQTGLTKDVENKVCYRTEPNCYLGYVVAGGEHEKATRYRGIRFVP
jgi:hypothetical protein